MSGHAEGLKLMCRDLLRSITPSVEIDSSYFNLSISLHLARRDLGTQALAFLFLLLSCNQYG